MPLTLAIEFQHSGYQNYPAELYPELANDCFVANCLANLDFDSPDVRRISELMDDSGMLSEEECEDIGLPPPTKKWISASDALSKVLALNQTLENRSPKEEIGSCLVGDAMEEVRAVIVILRHAVESGQAVRFDVAD